MPVLGPIKRRDLIKYFRQLGFDGPFVGRKHEVMIRGSRAVRIPNPHHRDIGRDLLVEILREAGITREEWERL